ncbi:hypothetical protein ACWEQ3_03335 [Streptomyces mirabilis]|uniref:hypothetical protein n=1 Tax=Streptomyces mirabilis TaxID=68239 RepID=UPI003800CC95
MSMTTLLHPQPELDLSEFDLELQIAVSSDSNSPLEPVAGFTKVTCGTKSQTSTIVSCVDELGPTCCA